MNQNQAVSAIKKMVVGCIIAEYGARQMLDSTKYELKKRVNSVIKSVESVENWFIYNQYSNDAYREIFKKEFKGNEVMMLAELFDTVFGLSDESLDEIIQVLKKNIKNVE
jgi:cysteine synthase